MGVTGKQERFHFLDGLRGIASLMIVCHHSITSNVVKLINNAKIPFLAEYFTNFTQSGVDLFFVLSGVVLLRPYLRKQREFRTGEYFKRRLLRIYPPYFIALLFAALVSICLYMFPSWYVTGNAANIGIAHLYFSWKELLNHAFIINFDGAFYNLAWWSLGVEVLFYLLVPVLIFIFPSGQKLTNKNIAILILGTGILAVALQLYFTKFHHRLYSYEFLQPTIFQFLGYPVCFLMGMLLAAKDFSFKSARIFMVLGLVLVLASVYYTPIVHSGYGLIYAGIVILSFTLPSLKRFLTRPLMIWLGERSYSIFLVHFSVFYVVDNFTGFITPGRNVMYAVISRGVGIPLALFVAMCLFHFVERRQARGLVTGDVFWPWQIKKMKIRLNEHNIQY